MNLPSITAIEAIEAAELEKVASSRKVLALDLGSRRIGVALSNTDRTMAFPRPMLERSKELDLDHISIQRLARDEGVDTVVVGLPLSLDGSYGSAANSVVSETKLLEARLRHDGIEVVLVDERFTTVSANKALTEGGKRRDARRRAVDSAAATVILEAWMDKR